MDNNSKLSFLDESTGTSPDRLSFLTESPNFEVTETVGGFINNRNDNDFDDVFENTYKEILSDAKIDVRNDPQSLVKNKGVFETYKNELLGSLMQEDENQAQNPDVDYGSHSNLYNQIDALFDNCAQDLYRESTSSGPLLPIKALDFPVLIKQQLKLATKDIIQTEVTKSPLIKKHIEQTWYVDRKTGKRWKYPQCFFNDEFQEVYAAGNGLPIKPVKVELPQYEFDVVAECTDGDPKNDEFTIDLRIDRVYLTDSQIEYILPTPMRVNLSDGSLLGGNIDTTIKDEKGNDVEVRDIITGFVDFTTHKVTISSAAGKVKAVVFGGKLSNERNERTVGFEYTRYEHEFKIDDGMRLAMPYTVEDLNDTNALLNIDLYKKTYNNIVRSLADFEDSNTLAWLDEMFKKYDGVELDPLGWNPFISKRVFDCDSTSLTTALPCEYIEKMLKFLIDGLILDIADRAKLEDMTFVIYGNPRFIRFLNPVVNWVTRPGSTANGVKLDYGYGIMTSGDVKVQVVSTMKVNAKYDDSERTFSGLRIIPFPLSQEQFTFKHYKYTTHILTSQNSAYRDASLPGGSMTYVLGTTRYTNAIIQGIQAQVKLANAEQYIDLH